MARWSVPNALLPLLSGAAMALAAVAACGGDPPAGPPIVERPPTPVPPDAEADVSCVASPTPAPFPTSPCDVPRPATPDAVDEALGLVGLDRCAFAFDPKQVPQSGWNLKDRRRLPDYEPLLLAPLRLPAYGRETARWLDEAVASERPVTLALAAAAQRRGTPVRACSDPSWSKLPAGPAPLAAALEHAITLEGGAPDRAALEAAVAQVPLELQRALGPVVMAIGQASVDVAAARVSADADAGSSLDALAQLPSFIVGSRALKLDAPFLAALDGVNVELMTVAAMRVAMAIEGAKLERFRGVELPNVDLETPGGAIVLRGKGNDTYLSPSSAAAPALLLDTGGDDTYRAAVAAGTLTVPVSVAIDLGGNDTYAYVEKPTEADKAGTRLPSDEAGRSGGRTKSRFGRQGSGVLGVGLLYDLGGSQDSYSSLAVSQGTGVLGVGVLYDDGGNDTYSAEALSQGASGFGIGLLLDRSGNDTYRGYSELQGFAFTQGVGALVDLDGDDTYFANPGDPALGGDPLYASAQLPGKGNTSMAQGCGMGRRHDTVPEGVGFLGGLGVLRDAKGKDTYTASVFAQASGFLGFGMLLDGSGDDTYEGLWYVQGSSAHLGMTLFHDGAGNDRYNPTFPIVATSIGVGHDFSVSIHLDEGGDDAYVGPGLSLGCGNANGLGALVNVGGKDTFKAPSPYSLGGASPGEVGASARGRMPSFGLFVKAGGSATYESVPDRTPGGSWSYAPGNTPPDGGTDGGDAGAFVPGASRSVGVDRAAGAALP